MKRRHLVVGGLTMGAIVLSGCNRSPRDIANRAIRALESDQIGGAAMAAEAISDEIIDGLAGRAFIRMIYWAEGTYPNPYGMNPYRIIFGYKLAPDNDFKDHPRDCQPIPYSSLCSDAAGPAQWLSTTYDLVWELYPDALIKDIPYFHPRNQDRAIILWVARTGAYWSLINGSTWGGIDRGVVTARSSFDRAVHQAATEWASLPLPDGSSIGKDYGGQRAYSLDQLWNVYQEHLNSWKNVVATS